MVLHKQIYFDEGLKAENSTVENGNKTVATDECAIPVDFAKIRGFLVDVQDCVTEVEVQFPHEHINLQQKSTSFDSHST